MSAMPEPTPHASAWRTVLPLFAGLVLALLLLYRDTVMAMVDVWSRSDTFAHGWLVTPISLWLIWRQRARLALLAPRPVPWVLAAMLPVVVAWLASDLVVVNAPTQFAFVFLLILAVPAVLGLEVTRTILFPLLFLLFAVPFGEFMVEPMMEWTADFVVVALQFIGVPVFREGLSFVIPTGRWSVIDECSGVRYLMASFMVGSLFAYLHYRSYARRAVFMLVSIAMPVVANWLRALMIVMLGHLSGNRIAVGVDHILYGWVFFGLVIFLMFVVGMRWAEADEPVPAAPAEGGVAASQGAAAASRRVAGAALAVLVVAALPHAFNWGLVRSEASAPTPRLELPPGLAPGWTGMPGKPALDWQPAWGNPSVLAHAAYAGSAPGAQGPVGLYIAYYRGQGPERKLVSSLNLVVPLNERNWTTQRKGQASARAGGQDVSLRSHDITGPGSAAARPHVTAWQVYWVDGRFVTGERQAKLATARARLQGRGDDGASVVIYAERATHAESAAAVQAFTRDNLGLVAGLLQRTRDAR
jgi:exosortase A